MISVGIQLYMVLDHLRKAPEATLVRLSEIGYREVEVTGDVFVISKDIRSMLARTNLICPSVHAPFGLHPTEHLLEEANSLGAKYVVSSVLFPSDDPRNDPELILRELNSLTAEEFRKIADRANEIGVLARRAGLRYIYHNHNFEFRTLDNGLNGYSILLDNTDPTLVSFEADCGWMAVAGHDPVELLRSFPGRFPLLHLKDFHLVGSACTFVGDSPPTTALGHGQLDYRELVWQAIELGAQHMFVEREPLLSGWDSLHAAAQDYQYLASILASGAPRK